MTPRTRRRTRPIADNGFTLVEITIVLVIVGIIISIAATVLPSLIQSSKIKKARAILEKIDISMEGYLVANGQCPCPDTDGDGQENRIPGAAPPGDDTCAGYVGDLPYLTLGLSNAVDPWQNPIRYAVYEDLIKTTNTGICAAAPCTLCLRDFSTNPTAAFLHTSAAAGSSNQAYIIMSGGSRDADGAGDFFDGRNTGTADVEFEIPDKIIDATYDDMVRSVSFTYLLGRLCSGGSSGGTPPAGEDTYTNGCTNGTDDDGDGDTDCADADCTSDPACSGGPAALDITTTTIPSGVVNSSYATSFSATGGTTPYEWTLLNNGGFTDFSLNTFSAALSGTLSQCPGSYNIIVRVEDDTPAGSGGPLTDSDTFAVPVTSDLAVSRTSGAGTSITWSASTQTETFQSTGGRLGTISWSLGPGAPPGFIVESTGADTCILRKNGDTPVNTYTFTLTAADSSCTGTNTADLSLTITITSGGGGTPGEITGTFDTNDYSSFLNNENPVMIHGAGNVYIVALKDDWDRVWLKTVEILPDGTMTAPNIDTQVITGFAVNTIDLVHVSGNTYAVTFDRTSNFDGYVYTYTIAANGAISGSYSDSLVFSGNGRDPAIVHVGGDVYAVAYRGTANDGYLGTFSITAAGVISNTVIDTLEFDTSAGYEPSLIQVDGEYFAVAYRGPVNHGYIKTIRIASNGMITNTVADTLEFDAAYCEDPKLINISGDIYAIAYEGQDSDGFVTTVQIAADGTITNATIDTLEFDGINGVSPDIDNIAGDYYAIAYQGENQDGFLTTFTIDSNGAIRDTVIDTYEFDTTYCDNPSMVQMNANMLAIYYTGPSYKGQLVTVTFE
ncbi:MAG: prepilin-type N-terminal cleavage/methylation domain-containing protein [Desulfobacteraceae bacterium]|nr:prepilin-type N-terminal cleavage/methylation domain-containing protein [Desulfobacteraceae bacterium]